MQPKDASVYHLLREEPPAKRPSLERQRTVLFDQAAGEGFDRRYSGVSHDHVSGRTSWLVDVSSARFSLGIAFVITLNAVVTGLQTDWGDGALDVFEHLFTLIFALEMLAKIDQLGPFGYASRSRNLFDAFLVLVSLLDLYVIPLFLAGHHYPVLQSFKLLRLFRILRIVRLFSIFEELSQIMQCFFKAFATVVWVSLLVLILDYVCAIFLTQLVGHNAALWEDKEEQISVWFGHIGNSMRTLFIIMTLSDWDDIVLTVSEKGNPFLIFAAAMCYILVTAYTMLSLITGSISEALITQQRQQEKMKLQEQEQQNDALAEQVRSILRMIDTDSSGSVSGKEVREALGDTSNRIAARLQAANISMNAKDLAELVERMAADSTDGEASIDEVADVLKNISGEAKAHTIFEIKHLIMKRDYESQQRFDAVQGEVAQLALQVIGIEEKLDLLLTALDKRREEQKAPGCGPATSALPGPSRRGTFSVCGPLSKAPRVQDS